MRQIVSAWLVLALPVIDPLPIVFPGFTGKRDPFGHASARVRLPRLPFSSGLAVFVVGVIRVTHSIGFAM